jgi:4-amino-4-deoxy-L-arabinose transferase-like glycosyltransferase
MPVPLAAPPSADRAPALCLAALLLASAAAHVAIRLLVPDGVEHDEAEQLLLAQTLSAGYGPHPPLYTWLQAGAFALLGVNVAALAVLKHTLLLAAELGVFLVARRALPDARLAALAVLSLWLVPPLAWEAHRDLTHSVLAAALVAATTAAFLRLRPGTGAGGYLALGVLGGLAVLGKPGSLVFLGALAVAAAVQPASRRVLGDPRMALAVGAGAVVVAPTAGWLLGHLGTVVPVVARRLGGAAHPVAGRLWAAADLAAAVLGFLGPLLLVAALVVPALLRPAGPAEAPGPVGRLLERAHLLAVGALALGVVAAGTLDVRGRWLLAVLVLAPVPLWARLAATRPEARRLRAFAVLALAAGGLSLAARVAEVGLGPARGRPTRLHAPTAALAGALRQQGFQEGTIVAGDTPLGGALRLQFPASPVLAVGLEAAPGPPADRAAPLLLIWRAHESVAPPPALLALATAHAGRPIPADPAPLLLSAPWPGRPTRAYALRAVLVPPASAEAMSR